MNDAINIFSSPAAEALGWALLYSVWEGLLIALVTIILLRFIPKNLASLRYKLSCIALLLVVISTAFTFIYLSDEGSSSVILSAPPNVPVITSNPGEIAAQDISSGSEQQDLKIQWLSVKAYVRSNMQWFVLFWLIGSIIITIRLFAGLWYANHLKKHTSFQTDAWNEKLQTIASKLHITRMVKLGESALTDVPIVLGHLKPLVVFPLGLLSGLSPDQIETIFMHELAHIKRDDYLTHIIQIIIESVFFFNPFVWFISRIIKREREYCCDDMVIQQGGNPMTYALALTQLEETRLSVTTLALSASGTGNQLLVRIRRMMEKSVKNYSISEKLLPIVLLILLMTCASWLTIEQYHYQSAAVSNVETKVTREDEPSAINREIPIENRKDIPLKNGPVSSSQPVTNSNNAQPVNPTVPPDPVYELKAQLRDPNYKIRAAAVESLSKYKNDSVGIWIAQTLVFDSSQHVRHRAVYVLGSYRSDYVFQILLRALDDPNEQIQQGAVESLTAIGNKAAFEPITKKLGSKNRIIRHVALMGIADLGDSKTIKSYLERALQDDDQVVRDFARYTLSRMEE